MNSQRSRHRLIVFPLCILLLNCFGCAELRQRVTNQNACAPANPACEYPIQSQMADCPSAAGPISAGLNELVALQEASSSLSKQISSLADADISLQDQLATLDQNAEQQRLESQQQNEAIKTIVQAVDTLRTDMQKHQSEIQMLRMSMEQQRDENDEILAVFENHLADVLSEFEPR